MTDTATPETGPVDAPASADSIAETLVAELDAGGEAPADGAEAIAQELVKEAEGNGEAQEAPETEEHATDPAEEAGEPEEGTPEEPTDEQMVTVKVAGEERQVPLSEALAGYSRLEDYKAKTAEVAQERRALEAQKATIDAELKAQYASQLEEATNLFAQFDPLLAEAKKIDWDALKQSNPAAYVQAQDAVQARLTAIQQMKPKIEALRAEAQQHQQEQQAGERTERFDRAAEKIIEKMPELADEAKFSSFAQDSIGYLRGEGFSPDEIADALDERVLTLADKARRWDAHEAAQKALPAKRIVPQSAVKALTTDASSSRAAPRFPAAASREGKANWIANQILSEE